MELMTVERHKTIVEQELYFLIAKFLLESPFKNVAEALIKELENSGKLPERIDWEGHTHPQGFHELAAKYRHIGPEHLLQICSRLPGLLEKESELTATVGGLITLLGAGRQSLLRTQQTITKPRTLTEYCARIHGAPLMDAVNRNRNNNIVNVLLGRQSAGPLIRKQAISSSFYTKVTLLRQTLGHLSAVYCVLFDRSGKHIVTGADDLLVKLWSAIDGRLLTTFRGASAEITDIAINLENTMIAAGSLDRVLRVWDLQNASVIAVLLAHSGMITSVNFCPNPKSDLKYLVTTSTDGSVAFWQYSQPRNQKPIFQTKPTQYHEKLRPGQAQMICASFSPGGMFLAAGSADHHVRVYIMADDGPKRILEIESHTDTVDSIQWAHSGLRFVSGSKDGTALLWRFETQQWKYEKLNMNDRLATCPPIENSSIDLKKGLKVTMVSWDRSDDWVVTAVNDHSIKVWNAKTTKLHNVLRGHTDELYVLESHPKDPYVLLSAGHDGQLFLWDIYKGEKLASFMNTIEGQGHGGIFDAKWSPCGSMIAATDSHGHMLMFGFGTGHKRLKEMPKELFFHTDYRPLVRDVNYYVLDEQTQLAPYLMPPPFLVDVDGNPYPPAMQRLVPGRESCTNEQLVPDIGVGEAAEQNGEEREPARSEIDRLIEALANRQNINDQNQINNNEAAAAENNAELPQQNRIQAAVRPPIRDQNISYPERLRTYVKSLKHTNLSFMKNVVYYAGVSEMDWYRREMKKRPLMIITGNPNSSALNGPPKKFGRGGRKRQTPGERNEQGGASTSGLNTTNMNNRTSTRQAAGRRVIDDDEERLSSSSESSNSDDSTAVEEDLDLSSSSSSDEDSSEYSDWIDVEDQQKLEPPKRSKRKPVERRTYSPADSDNQNNKKRGIKGIKKIPLLLNGEIPEEYKPPEWLSEVIPKKAPYYPQMGDEVVYFRQGHERYFEHVKSKKLYQLGTKYEPWQQLELREHEFCKVIGIKYEIRPPRLCCLKLALMTDNGNMTDKHFTIKYHDIPDVLDFLVLKQTFDTAISRNWGQGDRFRCMIDDKWWIGEIESHQALQEEFPDSLFMCFKVRWDNSEYEFMSPWDMEPIDEDRLPENVGGSVSVLPEEIQAILYRPKSEEWPRGDREGSCRRIVNGLDQVMGLAIADPFLTPVDLNSYPTYAYVVEYPIDLNTIKSRFENHFYRRITSAQFDVRYLATNAEKFNEKHSNIVKHARIITDLCLRILREHNDVDVPAAYHQLLDTYQSSESEEENQEPRPSTSRAAGSSTRPNGTRRSKRLVPATGDWRLRCREILQIIWNHTDSEPFREPVDIVEHPDYLQIIDTPMDLQTVKEELLSGNYDSPMDFAKDMKLIFQNSRSYNTNQRSRIYAMTLRMSELFEENIRPVISHYKSGKRGNKSKTPKKTNRRATRNNGNVPSTSRAQNSNDEDEDDDSNDSDDDKMNGRNGRVNGRTRRIQQQSNGVSSSQPARSRNTRNARLPSSNDEESETTESSSDQSSDGSEESSGIPLAELGKPITRSTRKKNKKQKRKQGAGTVSSSSHNKKSRKPAKRKKAVKSEEEDEEAEESEESGNEEQNSDNNKSDDSNEQQQSKKRSRRTRLQTTSDEEHHNNTNGNNNNNRQERMGDEPRRKRITRRPKRYESDTSFHVERPKRHKATDSEDSDHPRATRESARKKFQEWAVTSDDDNDDDDDDDRNDDFEVKPQTSAQAAERSSGGTRRSGRKKKALSDSDQSTEERTRTLPSRRSTRTRISQSQEDSEDENHSNRPSTSTNSGNNNNIRHSSRLTNGSGTTQSSSSQMSLRTTRSSYIQVPSSSSLRNDHNYESTSATVASTSQAAARQTRSTILSRHQRNADELDRSGLEDNNIATTSTNRLLRLRSVNLRAAPTPATNFEALNGIRRTTRVRTTHNYFEDENDPEEEEPVVQQIQSRLSSNSRTSRIIPDRSQRQATEDDSDSYSEEDKTPLKLVASSSKKKHDHYTRNGTSSSAVNRVKRNLYSDDNNSDQAPGPSGRNTRNLKRPHYNEDSDEEKARSTRRSKKRIVSQSQEDSDENSDEENGEPSVSSRGRIRKPTAKARGFH